MDPESLDELLKNNKQEKINLLTCAKPLVQHVFGVVENSGGGDCLFLALAQCELYQGQERLTHIQIRETIVNYVADHWAEHGASMRVQHKHQIQAFLNPVELTADEQKEAYVRYMSDQQVYGTAGEIQIASRIWDFNFSILMYLGPSLFERWVYNRHNHRGQFDVMNPNTRSGDTRPYYYFQFSGDPRSGHWEKLDPLYLPVDVRALPTGRFVRDYRNSEQRMTVYVQKPAAILDTAVKETTNRSSLSLFDSLVNIPTLINRCSSQNGNPNGRKRSRSTSPKTCTCNKNINRVKKRQKSEPCPKKGGRKRSKSRSPGKTRKTCSCEDNDSDSGSNPRKKPRRKARTPSPNKLKRSCSCGVCTDSDSDSDAISTSKCSKRIPIVSSCNKKRVLIAGVAGGLGRCLVQRFHEAGYRVFVIDNDPEALAEIEARYPGVQTYCVETLHWEESQCIVEDLLPLDYLVNNAGVLLPKRILDLSRDDVKCAFDVNFNWPLGISRAFCQGIINAKGAKRGGSIVNISSIFDRFALPNGAMYSCSQAALSALTRSLAVEFGSCNIRVNTVKVFLTSCNFEDNKNSECINPETSRSVRRYLDEMGQRSVLETRLTYGQIVDMVMFLLGPKSSATTGTEISIHAGITEY